MKWRVARVEYEAAERRVMRLLFAVVVAHHVPASLAHLAITRPNGFAELVDLQWLLDPNVYVYFRYATWIALVCYVLRRGWAVVLPYLALFSIAIGSITNSRGAISHSIQIVSLVLLAQTAAHYYSLLRRSSEPREAGENRAIWWSQQTIVAVYLVSGVTKLLETGGAWFFQTPLIAVQILKTTDQTFYNMLDASGRETGLAVADWIVQHPLLAGLILSGGLLLELAAPVALLGRRFALAIGLSLVLFHETVQRVMTLYFVWNEYLIWIYLVNVPFWILLAWRAVRRRRAGDSFA